MTVRIQARVDGHTRLTLNGNMAQWHHLVNAAPGRLNGGTLATQINGADWFPTWPDLPTPENRNCNCMSDMYTSISPAIPRSPMVMDVVDWTARDRIILIQEPSAQNSYTTILEFEDDPSGDSLYMVELTFDPT